MTIHGNNTVIMLIKTLEGFMTIDTLINNVITIESRIVVGTVGYYWHFRHG